MVLNPAILREKLASVPVVKAGLSLMTGTVLTSALGLVFWILAARLYDTSQFGLNTTAIYTMTMLADVACLGLRMGVVRYLPRAGKRTVKTIIWSYGLVFLASAATAAVFLAGLNWWAPRLLELRSSLLLFAFFVVSTSFWALFMLQDGVLVGLRKAPWVPAENTLFGILKIVLLFPLASLSPTLGIFWAWTLPVFPIVFGISAMIAKLAPKHATKTSTVASGEPEAELKLREIMSFSLADWVSSVARLAALGVIPLMVLATLDDTATAYFQAAWLIGFTVFALSLNVAYALLAENSYERDKARRNSMQAVALGLALTVPIVVVGGLGAPWLLQIYGADFAANSTWTLRLLLLAALPNVIYQIYVGRLRSESKMAAVVASETVLSITVVGLAWVLLPRFGIEGVGLAWLAGLLLMAVFAAASESQWWWASRLDTRLVRRAGSMVRRLRGARPARGLDVRLSGAIAAAGDTATTVRWAPGDDDFQTAVVTLADGRGLQFDFARSATGAAELERLDMSIARLHGDPRLAAIHDLLPQLEARQRTEGQEYLAWLDPVGPTALEIVETDEHAGQICQAALAKLSPLHEMTAITVTVDEDMVERWIQDPLARLATTGRASAGNVTRLRCSLIDAFSGVTLDIGHIHGGLCLESTVMDSRTGSMEVIGFANWGRTAAGMPTAIDRAMLTLSDLSFQRGDELGDVVRDVLVDPEPFERHPVMANPTAGLPSQALVLLAWLHFVGKPSPQQTVAGEAFWLARNAQPVLASLNGLVGSPS
ncbi:MAG: lipopolysaccharide biosynthesis protein [Acidimicrobiales bacterium]